MRLLRDSRTRRLDRCLSYEVDENHRDEGQWGRDRVYGVRWGLKNSDSVTQFLQRLVRQEDGPYGKQENS